VGWLIALSSFGGGSAADNAQVVKIVAQQWSFSPNTVTIPRGQTIDFELMSTDVHRGFNLPDFNLRADVVPGQTTKLRVTLDKAGTYGFHCDYFCGSGHEGTGRSSSVVIRVSPMACAAVMPASGVRWTRAHTSELARETARLAHEFDVLADGVRGTRARVSWCSVRLS
jgi:cytochrome c oxidase subunit 2